MISTQDIWKNFGNEIYFFILKKVKNKNTANDIYQESFLKIHKNISTLKQRDKLKPWIYQIVRNEIANFFNKEKKYTDLTENKENITEDIINYCCFDKFLNALPDIYKNSIELIYIEGKKQYEVAKILGISLANVKIRVKRGKEILKQNLLECCHYQIDKKGNLVGEPNCNSCEN